MRWTLCLLAAGLVGALSGCRSTTLAPVASPPPVNLSPGAPPVELPEPGQTQSAFAPAVDIEQTGFSPPPATPQSAPVITADLEPTVPNVQNLMPGDPGSPSIAAQDLPAGAPLSLEAVESLASQHNPTLVQATAQIQANYAKALQAGLYPNPTLKYIAEQIGVEDTAGEFQGAEITQRFVTADKLELSRQKYQMRARVAEIQSAAQGLRVINDVRIHFYRTLGAQQLVALKHELLKHAEDQLVTAREMHNLGHANKVDVHHANVELQQARLELKMAENRLAMEQAQLQALIGACLPPGTPVTGILEGELCLLEYQPTLCRILSESPEIAAARAKLQSDQITLERERVEPIPDIVVSSSSGYNFEADDAVYGAQVQVEVPLFDRNQGTIRQAEWDLIRQQAEIRRVELQLTNRLAQTYRYYLNAYQQVQDYQTVVLPESREAYAKSLQSYKEDREDWVEVLENQHKYIELRVEYVTALVELRERETLMQGLLLSDGLEAAEDPLPPSHIDATPQPR